MRTDALKASRRRTGGAVLFGAFLGTVAGPWPVELASMVACRRVGDGDEGRAAAVLRDAVTRSERLISRLGAIQRTLAGIAKIPALGKEPPLEPPVDVDERAVSTIRSRNCRTEPSGLDPGAVPRQDDASDVRPFPCKHSLPASSPLTA